MGTDHEGELTSNQNFVINAEYEKLKVLYKRPLESDEYKCCEGVQNIEKHRREKLHIHHKFEASGYPDKKCEFCKKSDNEEMEIYAGLGSFHRTCYKIMTEIIVVFKNSYKVLNGRNSRCKFYTSLYE